MENVRTSRSPRNRSIATVSSISMYLLVGLIAVSGSSAKSLAGGKDSAPSPTSARRETTERLKSLGSGTTYDTQASNPTSVSATISKAVHPDGSSPVAAQHTQTKALQELLHERLHWLDEFDKATKSLEELPAAARLDGEIATDTIELQRLNDTLAHATGSPETLLPPGFPKPGSKITEAMKQALESKHAELKTWASKLEMLETEAANWEAQQAALQNERDKLFHKVAVTNARIADRDGIDSNPAGDSSRRFAEERLVNLEWEARVETLQLQSIEARISLAPKLASARNHEIKVLEARVKIETKTIVVMQKQYTRAAELQEQELVRKADSEKSLARSSNDPLVRFRARRDAELFELEAQVIANEQNLATNPPPCFDEQKALADHAVADIEAIKHLLADGRVSRLDAIRLNNDFRRIGPERDRLFRNEMASVEARLQYYENLLTSVELELLQDSLHDTLENDLQRERVDPELQRKVEQLINEYELKHRNLLTRRKDALERLSLNASQTLDQITRRLDTLDEEYGFIRTHIFWVRDREPIGLGTLTLLGRELPYLATGLLRLARESAKATLWGSPSIEFMATSLLMLVLPFGVVRLRSGLRAFIERDLPGECCSVKKPATVPAADAPA